MRPGDIRSCQQSVSLSRPPTLLTQRTRRGCDTGTTTAYTTHAILIFRLYGLYGSRNLTYALCALSALSVATGTYVAVVYVPYFTAYYLGPSIGTVCVPSGEHLMSLVWYIILLSPQVLCSLLTRVTILAVDIPAFALALYKGLQQFKDGDLQASRLMQIMLKDSLEYFCMWVVASQHKQRF